MAVASNIVNLEDLVPGLEGKTFRMPVGVEEDGVTKRYEDYHIPGDLDSETVFEFLKLFEDMVQFQARSRELQTDAGDDPEANAQALAETMQALRDLNDAVKAKLLVVFQVARPDLKTLPFGASTTMVVLGVVLEMMGIAAPSDGVAELPVPPDPPEPNRAARRASTGRKTTSSSTNRAGQRQTQTRAK